MKNQEEFVATIIQSMQDIIAKHGLELMQHYPNDLLVHDKANLMVMAVPGAHIAWLVGDRHTHIVNLGLSKEENEMVGYLTRLSNNDKFYSLKISPGHRVVFKELMNDEFAALASSPVGYSMSCGDSGDFWLMKGNTAIGHILVEGKGTYQDLVWDCTVRPVEGISGLDTAALNHWASKAVIKSAGTLFCRSNTIWGEPIPVKQAA